MLNNSIMGTHVRPSKIEGFKTHVYTASPHAFTLCCVGDFNLTFTCTPLNWSSAYSNYKSCVSIKGSIVLLWAKLSSQIGNRNNCLHNGLREGSNLTICNTQMLVVQNDISLIWYRQARWGVLMCVPCIDANQHTGTIYAAFTVNM